MRHIGVVAVAFLQASAHVGAFLPPASPTQTVGQRRLSTVAHINLEGIPLEPSAAPALLEPVSSAVMDPTLQLVLDQAVPIAALVVGALVAAEVRPSLPSLPCPLHSLPSPLCRRAGVQGGAVGVGVGGAGGGCPVDAGTQGGEGPLCARRHTGGDRHRCVHNPFTLMGSDEKIRHSSIIL